MPGLPDIIGHCRTTGRAVYCEVKTAGDRLSEDQRNFLETAHNVGCIVHIATVDDKGDPLVKEWKDGQG